MMERAQVSIRTARRWLAVVPAIAIAAWVPATACRRGVSPRSETGAGAAHARHWGYEEGPESVGPAHWGELAGDELCSLGKLQSPIALATSGPGAATLPKQPALAFDYEPSKLSMENNGHTVQFGYEPGSSVSEGGASYRLAQFHFHSPSEHTLDGHSFPLEIHFVHVNAAGKPELVVGVFVQEGQNNAALDAAFSSLPKEPGEKSMPLGATIDASALLPRARAHFAYDGSLTTPPCSEGIRWRVMEAPIEMSAAQIGAFRSLPHLAHTNRPLQPAGARANLLVEAP